MTSELEKIIEKLSPLERKIIPFLNLDIEEIENKSGLDNTSVLRALRFLESKNIVKITKKTQKTIELGTNGIYYKKTSLPERKLLGFLESNTNVTIDNAKKLSKLSDNEFDVSLGLLKNRGFVEIKDAKIKMIAHREEIIKKTPEEQFLELLPIDEEKLNPDLAVVFSNLKKRKDIIRVKEIGIIKFELTEIGKQLIKKDMKTDLIEEITPEIIRNWGKNKKFRVYDIKSHAPMIYGGKKHFVNQSIDYAKRIWLDFGFKEMTGPIAQTAFWNFDSLFTPQDHPAREMQDTFFIKGAEGRLPEKAIVAKVKQAHESGVDNSKGWGHEWHEKEARKVVLRTHTTALSAQTLAKLKETEIPAKYFTIGKVFRNETLDWKHAFEFYQTEGIVIDRNATFRHLLGYLQEFYRKMGFKKIKFAPTFYPFTEPSVEIQVFHEERKEWLELGGGGIFRPEVVIPLFGKNIPVLAWGQGFDRIISDYYKIKDLREMYSNDLKQLRSMRMWIK